jgi:hypothetical protein
LRVPWKYLKVSGIATDIPHEMEVREGVGMSRSQLDADGVGEPIWEFVAQMGTDRFTGQATVGVSPRVHLYAFEGRVYFAERDGDAAIESRFVNMGVLTPDQLDRGAVRLGNGVSLARLFSREPAIDRDAVELALEMMTAQTLESVAMEPTGAVELFPLRHHATGIHQWNPLAAPQPVDHAVAAPPHDTPVTDVLANAADDPVAPVTRSVPQVGKVEIADPSTLPTLGAWNPPTVEERMRGSEDRYAPKSDFSTLNLPKLASRPMSVDEITAAQAAAPAPIATPLVGAGEDLATLVQRINDDDLADPVPSIEQEAAFVSTSAPVTPSAPSGPPISWAEHAAASFDHADQQVAISSITLVADAPICDTAADDAQPLHASVFANLPPLTREAPSTLVTSTFAQIVKTPASNPTVEQGMDLEALFAAPPAPPRPAHEVPFSASSWEPPVSPQATAEEIWGLVDEMVDHGAQDDSLVTSGATGEKKPRGWRRSKKG